MVWWSVHIVFIDLFYLYCLHQSTMTTMVLSNKFTADSMA